MPYELGIIGAGNMAEAIVRGVLHSGQLTPNQIIVADVSQQRRDLFTNQLHIQSVDDNLQVAKESESLLLSVKPQQAQSALAGIGSALNSSSLVISIMAGISTGFIESSLGQDKQWRVIRTMPNTPMLVGQGVVAIAPGKHATDQDIATARHIFEAAASVVQVEEKQIDAVTALSGSGPAYFFFLVEQMIQAGIDLGLSPQQAHLLATKTALGAGKMLVDSQDSPQELRKKVASPGGTTHAAITFMESQALPATIINALKAAHKRSRELGT